MQQTKSKYLAAFQEAAKTFTLVGNKILIERIDDEEVKTASGFIMASASNSSSKSDFKTHRPLVGLVIAIGEGYTGDTSEAPKLPLDVQPGSVVMLNSLGVSFFSTLPGFSLYSEMKVGIASESDVQMRFENLEAYEAYKKSLAGALSLAGQ